MHTQVLADDDPHGALISLIVEQSGLNQNYVLMRLQNEELTLKATAAGASDVIALPIAANSFD